MPTVSFPAVWPDVAAPVANLLTVLGSPWAWWAAAAVGLVAGLALYKRRPRVALALAVAATLALGVAANGLVDDAYIQFRYAANLAAGQGPVFNPGERIEGASGGLWIGVLAAGERLTGFEPGIVGRLLSLLFATLATLLVGLALLRRGPPAQALAALAWAALPTAAWPTPRRVLIAIIRSPHPTLHPPDITAATDTTPITNAIPVTARRCRVPPTPA